VRSFRLGIMGSLLLVNFACVAVAREDAGAPVTSIVKPAERLGNLLKRLEVDPELTVFRDIAALGENGKAAGPTLGRFLGNSDWDVRLGAARALGYVGYAEAVPELIKLLNEKDDWRLVYVSVESLGRLRRAEAVEELTRLSKEHWFPPVRDAAEKAVLVINGKDTYQPDRRFNFAHEFFSYQNARSRKAKRNADRSYVNQPDELDKSQLAKLAYKVRLSPNLEPNLVPDVGIKVDDGYLVGFDQGEFGGGLVFVDLAGNQSRPLCGNTQGICHLGSDIVAATGVAHLSTNIGILYKVAKGDNGVWQATRWKALPGAPGESGILANGNLCIVCSGGTVEISPASEIKMASAE
jgi:hypothetical protein